MGYVEFVHTHHGAGDRAGSFARQLAGLDPILAAESKVRKRLTRAGLVESAQCIVIGNSKFDGEEGIVGSTEPV